MPGLFDSAWMKWGWAVVHAQTLDAELGIYGREGDEQRIYTSRTEYDPKRHCIRQIFETIEPLPVKWGLQIGDIANNYRACLDHLAWAVVSRGNAILDAKRERNVYFPIALDREDFATKVHSVLPGITRTDRAIIRRYQPYVWGKRNIPFHVLTPLPGLTRDDKHREIRPVWAAPTSALIEYTNPIDCEITKVPDRGRRTILEVGAEVNRIYVRRTGPKPEIQMKASLSAKPLLNESIWLGDWLAKISDHIRDLLLEFARPPDTILELGIKPAVQSTESSALAE